MFDFSGKTINHEVSIIDSPPATQKVSRSIPKAVVAAIGLGLCVAVTALIIPQHETVATLEKAFTREEQTYKAREFAANLAIVTVCKPFWTGDIKNTTPAYKACVKRGQQELHFFGAMPYQSE